MPDVFIPPRLRPLTENRESVFVSGSTLGELIDNLEADHPGIRDRLCDANGIRPELSVSIDDSIVSNGLATHIPPNAEIHFLPALGGG